MQLISNVKEMIVSCKPILRYYLMLKSFLSFFLKYSAKGAVSSDHMMNSAGTVSVCVCVCVKMSRSAGHK